MLAKSGLAGEAKSSLSPLSLPGEARSSLSPLSTVIALSVEFAGRGTAIAPAIDGIGLACQIRFEECLLLPGWLNVEDNHLR